MKRSSFFLTSIRSALLAIFIGVCLTASGSGSSSTAPTEANQDVDPSKPIYDNTSTFEKSNFEEKTSTATLATKAKSAEAELKANQAQLKDALQKQMNALLLENAEINRKRIELLESDKRKAFWTQSLVIFLIAAIAIALFYFWRLHAARVINNSLVALSDTLSNFQDSFFNLVDTTQLASNSSVSSFQIPNDSTTSTSIIDHKLDLQTPARRTSTGPKTRNIASDYSVEELSSTSQFGAAINAQIEAEAQQAAAAHVQEIENMQANSAADSATNSVANTQALAPQQADEFFAVKGYVDSWLRVYKPSDTVEESEASGVVATSTTQEKQLPYAAAIAARKAVASKPESPRSMLARLDSCRANHDAEGYEKVYKEIKKLFNLKLEPWEMLGEVEQKQLSDFPHVINKILELWHSDQIIVYLERLLSNSRINPREGFDLAIYQKLEDLLELARAEDRPRDLQQLKKLDRAAFLFVPLPSKTLNVANTKLSNNAETEVKKPNIEPALKIDSRLSYANSKIKSASLEAMITPEIGALDVQTNTKPAVTTQVATEVPTLPATKPETSTEASKSSEDKFLLSPFEVRIKLAVAYTEMGDREGAILLLEEVINDAPLSQRKHAERLLKEIQDKKARFENRLTHDLPSTAQ